MKKTSFLSLLSADLWEVGREDLQRCAFAQGRQAKTWWGQVVGYLKVKKTCDFVVFVSVFFVFFQPKLIDTFLGMTRLSNRLGYLKVFWLTMESGLWTVGSVFSASLDWRATFFSLLVCKQNKHFPERPRADKSLKISTVTRKQRKIFWKNKRDH